MIIGLDLLNELGIILDFKDKTITWDKAQIIMRTYPSENTANNIAKTWFLDTAEETTIMMNDDRINPLSEKSTSHNDIFFQENNTTTKGYKSK